MTRLSEAINVNNKYSGEIPRVCLQDISIIVPVRNNQEGINRFMATFFATHEAGQLPKEIIIVDNASKVPITLSTECFQRGISVRVHPCLRRGPAAARNRGVEASTGNWLLFCDSDCIPTPSLLAGYLNNATKKAVAYAGNVKATPTTWLARYYDEEEILIPYRKCNSLGEPTPLYVVTANALVWKWAFNQCGKFDERFRYAGGEDVDLGRRLWQIGNIEYRRDSLILHDFSDGFGGFCRRFARYGRGNRQLEDATGIIMRPKLRFPKRLTPFNAVAIFIQHFCLSAGYYGERCRVRSNYWNNPTHRK